MQQKICVAVHAGAGYHSKTRENLYDVLCVGACNTAASILLDGGSALDAKHLVADNMQETSGDESQSSSTFISRKRRRLANASQHDLCQEIFDGVRAYRGDGGSLSETFMRLPPKRSNPEYYEAIKEPMDLAHIQAKIKSGEYKSVDDMAADVGLIVENTKAFYPSSTKEFIKAVELQEVFNKEREKILSVVSGSNASTTSSVSSRANRRRRAKNKREETDEDELESASIAASEDSHLAASETSTTNMTSSSQRSSGLMENPYELLFASIVKYICEDGRSLAPTFTYLPSKEAYPVYYTVIKEPIDLRMIARRIQSGSYTSMDDLEKDFALMARNAKTFNEPKSLIYQDASTVARILKGKRSEAEHPPVRANRERGKRVSRLSYNPRDIVEEYASLPEEQPIHKSEPEASFCSPEDDDTQATGNTSQSMPSLPSSTEKRKRGRPPKVHSTIPSSPSTSRDSFTASSPIRLSSPLSQSPSSPLADPSHSSTMDSSVTHSHVSGQYSGVCRYRVGTVRWRVAQVLQTVLDARSEDGHLMCAPFLRLPSRKIYPDYYQEIANPLSLADMKKKLKANAYPSLNSIMADLELVFKNAQQYNVEDSVIYKDSLALHEIAKKRYQEMVNYQPSSFRRTTPGHGTHSYAPGASHHLFDRSTPFRRLQKRVLTADEAKVKRLHNVFNSVFSYVAEDGHRPRDVFLHLPSKDEYPDYYKVIPEPIDLTIIRKKMDQNEYGAHQEMVADLRLMFKNARHYNEEGSLVYNDAVTLEKVLKRRLKSLGPYQGNASKRDLPHHTSLPTSPMLQSGADFQFPANVVAPPNTGLQSYPQSQPGLPLLQRVILELFQTVREYHDHGRQLSAHFMRLPTRAEMPTYYEFIRKPIELQTIAKQVVQMRYTDFEDFVSDLFLMFDNACRFNEPGSQIYADSLTLLRVCLAKRAMILNTFASHLGIPPCLPPDVSTGVRRLLTNLHNSMLTACDSDGRGLVDSLIAGDGTETMLTSVTAARLAALHRAVAAGSYRRLDRLQGDWLEILKRARIGEGREHPADSGSSVPTLQQRLDAAELARRWVRLRDEIFHRTQRRPVQFPNSSHTTSNTDSPSSLPSHLTLLSPAASYTAAILERELSEEQEKYVLAPCDDQNGEGTVPELRPGEVELPHVQPQEEVFYPGDFVYIGSVRPVDITQCPIGRIVRISRVLNEPTDSETPTDSCATDLPVVITVARYFRPAEARPSRRRRLLSPEVFRTALIETISPDKLAGHCVVMHIAQFIRFRPKDIEERNTFVCESQFSIASQTFLKIRNWDIPTPVGLELEQRPVAFIPTRLPPSEPLENALQQVDPNLYTHMTYPLPRTYQSVVLDQPQECADDVVYEQYVHENGFLVKLGDFLYVPALAGPCDRHIVRVDKLWRSSAQNAVLFSGPWFVLPAAVDHLPSHVFYPKEVFITDAEMAIHALASATGKCFVMRPIDYCQARPTDYHEQDTYLCDSKYYEGEKVIHKLKKGLKRVQLSDAAYEDEFFFFPQPICPRKEASPLLNQSSPEPLIQEQLNRPFTTAVNCAVAASSGSGGMLTSPLASLPSASAPHAISGPPSSADPQVCEIASPPTEPGQSTSSQPVSSPTAAGHIMGTGEDVSLLEADTDRSRKKRKLRKPPSGYVIYAGEVRKRLLQERRDAPFGEISREVGLLWRQMPSSQRDFYERKAKLIKRRMEEEEMRAKAREQEMLKMQQQQQQQPNPALVSMPMDGTHVPPGLQQQPPTLTGTAAPVPPHAVTSPYQPSAPHMPLGGPTHMQFYQSPSGQVFQILHAQSSASSVPGASCHPNNSAISFSQTAVPTGAHQVIYQLPGHPTPMVPSTSLGPYIPQSAYYTQPPQQRVLVASNMNQAPTNPVAAIASATGQSNLTIPLVSSAQMALGTTGAPPLQQLTNPPHPTLAQPNISLVPNVQTIPVLTQHSLALTQPQVNVVQPNMSQTLHLVPGAPPNVASSAAPISQPFVHSQTPIFVSAPPRTSRVLHSEIYQRYINRLQKHNSGGLSDWRNQLSVSPNTAFPLSTATASQIASGFLANPQNHAHHSSVTEALWSLRDHLLEDSLKIRLRYLNSVECS